jgi:protein-tyrosine phosphatase
MMLEILVVCTANRCRSPMAGALIKRAFADAGSDIGVQTAGFLESGFPPPEGVVAALARHGIDVGASVSRTLTPEMVANAGLVIGMERAHVRDIALRDPGTWSRTFTFKELVRRGEHIGPRSSDETAEAWIAAAHRGRRPDDLLGADDIDNVADPMGGAQRAYDRTADELGELASRLVGLLMGPAVTGSDTGARARV